MKTISAIEILANIRQKELEEGIQYSLEEKLDIIVDALRRDTKVSKQKDGKR